MRPRHRGAELAQGRTRAHFVSLSRECIQLHSCRVSFPRKQNYRGTNRKSNSSIVYGWLLIPLDFSSPPPPGRSRELLIENNGEILDFKGAVTGTLPALFCAYSLKQVSAKAGARAVSGSGLTQHSPVHCSEESPSSIELASIYVCKISSLVYLSEKYFPG